MKTCYRCNGQNDDRAASCSHCGNLFGRQASVNAPPSVPPSPPSHRVASPIPPVQHAVPSQPSSPPLTTRSSTGKTVLYTALFLMTCVGAVFAAKWVAEFQRSAPERAAIAAERRAIEDRIGKAPRTDFKGLWVGFEEIKRYMHDPRSFELVEASPFFETENGYRQVIVYRAKNAIGALTVRSMEVIVKHGKLVNYRTIDWFGPRSSIN